jgi:alkanesulfonate monooxygenase SsuD/methylene tetrahydromethanopterin reductase-like flavin-dependent oxidoreductase (luciferase family)
MKFGFVLPYGDARPAAELAQQAESSGWDGFFVWDPVWGVDPWVTLAAAAMLTSRIRLGTMITPASRRRPWKLASETATLDRLSGGRAIFATGLGAVDTGFEEFGEVTERKQRAGLLDESLAIMDGLWRGQPFNFDGKHYRVKECTFYPPPPPVQQPRIPVWVVGAWPFDKSLARAARWDGLLPAKMNPETRQFETLTPDTLREMKAWIDKERIRLGIEASTKYDIIMDGTTPPGDPARAAEQMAAWAEAGATWWIETMWGTEDLELVRRRILAGPPGQ